MRNTVEQFFCDNGAHDSFFTKCDREFFLCCEEENKHVHFFFQIGPEKVEVFFILLARCTKEKEKWCRSPFALAKGITVFPANFTKYL